MSEKSLINAATLYLYLDRLDEAKEYLDKIIQLNQNSSHAQCLLGWINENSTGNTSYFDTVLENAPRDLGALMGKMHV